MLTAEALEKKQRAVEERKKQVSHLLVHYTHYVIVKTKLIECQ